MPQPTQSPTQPSPVSGRQRQFFRYQLELALGLRAEQRHAFLEKNGWTMPYLYAMAEVEAVRQVTLTPEEAQALLADLQQRAAARESPGLRRWRQRRQQASMPDS